MPFKHLVDFTPKMIVSRAVAISSVTFSGIVKDLITGVISRRIKW